MRPPPYLLFSDVLCRVPLFTAPQLAVHFIDLVGLFSKGSSRRNPPCKSFPKAIQSVDS